MSDDRQSKPKVDAEGREVGDRGRDREGRTIFSWAWREGHARAGDVLLDAAEGAMESINWEKIRVFALLAQAHYAAANVRAKPTPAPGEPPARFMIHGRCGDRFLVGENGPTHVCVLWPGHEGFHSDGGGNQWRPRG